MVDGSVDEKGHGSTLNRKLMELRPLQGIYTRLVDS